MKVKSYTEILTTLCDLFDGLIKPKKLSRSDDNLLYKNYTASAKAFETIHNTCVVLESKFDPVNCPDEDLESVGKLVGTKKLSGKQTALRVLCTNTTQSPAVLPAGTYRYKYSDDITFTLTLSQASSSIPAGASKMFTFYSSKIGSYYLAAQSSISLYYDEGVQNLTPAGLTFSSLDNVSFLGRDAESPIAFRKRVLQDNRRQDEIKELENAIKDLPYIFDASVTFNGTGGDITIDGVTVHPFCIIIALLGEPREEIAEIVAGYGYYPTTVVDAGNVLQYKSACLAGGAYNVYYMLFSAYEYDIAVDYEYNSSLNSPTVIESAILKALSPYMYPTERISSITENTFYSLIDALALSGILLRNVTLKVNGSEVPYISIPRTKIGTLVNVTFTKDVES